MFQNASNLPFSSRFSSSDVSIWFKASLWSSFLFFLVWLKYSLEYTNGEWLQIKSSIKSLGNIIKRWWHGKCEDTSFCRLNKGLRFYTLQLQNKVQMGVSSDEISTWNPQQSQRYFIWFGFGVKQYNINFLEASHYYTFSLQKTLLFSDVQAEHVETCSYAHYTRHGKSFLLLSN